MGVGTTLWKLTDMSPNCNRLNILVEVREFFCFLSSVFLLVSHSEQGALRFATRHYKLEAKSLRGDSTEMECINVPKV